MIRKTMMKKNFKMLMKKNKNNWMITIWNLKINNKNNNNKKKKGYSHKFFNNYMVQ